MRDVPEHCESILNPIASSKLKIFDNHLKNIRTCLSEVSQITKSIKTSKLESKRKCGTSSNSPLSKPEYDSVQSVESKYKRQNKDESSNNEKNLSDKKFDDNNTLKVHGTGAGRRKSGSKQTSASSVHYLDLTRAPSIEVKLQHPFTSIKTDVSSSEMYSDDTSSTAINDKNKNSADKKKFDDNNTLKVHGTGRSKSGSGAAIGKSGSGARRSKAESKRSSAASVTYLDLTRAPSIEVKLQQPFMSIKTDVSSSEMYSDDRSSTESVRRSINLSHSKLQNHKTSDVKVITGPCDEYLVLKICLIVKVSDYHYQILVDSVWVFSYIFIFIFK